MLEIVTASALTAFLTAVGNGAGGEMGKQLLLSTGAMARRTLGRETPLPTDPEQWQALAAQLHPRLGQDQRQAGDWDLLMRSAPGVTATLPRGPGLPPPTRDFTDREQVLKRLRRELTRPAAGRPRAALLYGPPGIGTSAVALHWGALRAGSFPDGRFHVDLRDVTGAGGPEPAAVLLLLLRQMGVEPGRMPPTEAGRRLLYRQLIADRKVLVLIDHASSAAQVRGLVPSTPGVFLLVVASGPPFALEAERIPVPPLGDRDALKLLRKAAGREQVARARAQVPGLLEDCAGNAFALRAAAMRLLAGEPALPGRTAGTPERNPVRGMAQDACRRLPPETARLCRLTALSGLPDVDAQLAAAAADVGQEAAARMLADATDVHLLEPLPDQRYRIRPEVRRYLVQTAGPEHGIADCSAAVARVLDALLNRVLHAAHAALPQSWRTEPAPERGVAYPDGAAGVAVLAAEAGNVAAAVAVAVEHQHVTTALRLARALWPLQLKAGHWDEVLPALRAAAGCADEHRPDTRMAGALHFQLGHCLGELGRWEEADRAAHAAVACERAAGHVRGEASSVELLGLLSLNRWRYEAAYEWFVGAERVYGRITTGQEGADDLPRASALVKRHQGRALRGMGRLEESRVLLEDARDFFTREGEAYNRARALTDLAETLHEAGDDDAALTAVAEAGRLLGPEAAPHLRYLAGLRTRCEQAR
ncbi:tetratricopeptide repeat protein [Streptomyces sp. NBC_01754]|uniref:ATP-binding protein n=1 Tax=Streptomyces sp. NBC_01754 TaxID=2975930 RepID=UPI002DD9E5EE|nr:ATP-binding protein [Streptomyces sp. NBC_01754]WSC93872.1 tetratricopeptide repeat protein [Streptomyces sp. NBC_01754]